MKNRLSQEVKRRRFIEVVYSIPNPLNSLEEWQRFVHNDLADMTIEELRREYDRVDFCILFDDSPHPWLIQRREQVEQVINER